LVLRSHFNSWLSADSIYDICGAGATNFPGPRILERNQPHQPALYTHCRQTRLAKIVFHKDQFTTLKYSLRRLFYQTNLKMDGARISQLRCRRTCHRKLSLITNRCTHIDLNFDPATNGRAIAGNYKLRESYTSPNAIQRTAISYVLLSDFTTIIISFRRSSHYTSQILSEPYAILTRALVCSDKIRVYNLDFRCAISDCCTFAVHRSRLCKPPAHGKPLCS
jgi:hypothetical protein